MKNFSLLSVGKRTETVRTIIDNITDSVNDHDVDKTEHGETSVVRANKQLSIQRGSCVERNDKVLMNSKVSSTYASILRKGIKVD